MVDKLLPIYRSLPSAFKNEFSMNHFGMAQSYVRRALWRYSLNALETITDLELEILLQDAFRGQREYFQRKGKKR
jgi:hypothetical protein